MTKQEFQNSLQGYNPEVDREFVKFSYLYPIKKTKNGAMLFKYNETRVVFVPICCLRLSRDKKDVYILRKNYQEILQED